MNKNPSPTTRFKPGNDGHGGGRPPGLITTVQVKKAIAELFEKDKSELADIVKQSGKSLYQLLASVILHAIQKGDISKLDGLLCRAVGKVKDQVEHTNKAFIYKRPNGDEIVSGISTEDEETNTLDA